MRKVGTVLTVMGALLLISSTALAGGGGDDEEKKVTICHAAGQEGTTHYIEITVGYNAVYGEAGHFYENGTPRAGHEQDYLGPCEEDDDGTTTTTTEATTTTTAEETTTTTMAEETTTTSTTVAETTTTTPSATTSAPDVTTTQPPVITATPDQPEELPYTGFETWLTAALGLGLIASGGLLVRRGNV